MDSGYPLHFHLKRAGSSKTEGDVILVLTPAGKLETQCYVNVLPDRRRLWLKESIY